MGNQCFGKISCVPNFHLSCKIIQDPLNTSVHINTFAIDSEASFEKLFRELYTPLCRTILKIVHNKEIAEDLAQDSFFVLWEKKSEITVSPKSYLYRIAINKAFNHLQKFKKFVPVKEGDLTEFEPSGNVTEEHINLVYAEKAISEAIESLPPACRAIFLMSRTDEMSYKEISDSLEISVKTVENQMSKALRILREKLILVFLAVLSLYINYL